jgi:hypothetical protein
VALAVLYDVLVTPSQRYLFAHRALPQVVHDDPGQAQTLLSGPEGFRFLAFLWGRVGERLPEEARGAPRGLACETHTGTGGRRVVLVTMPPPERAPEAYFAAIVFTPGPRKLLFFRHPPTAAYLTLELGQTLEREPRTVLCGWSKEGTHFNMGDGPPPESEAFLERVLGMDDEGAS